MIDIVITIPPGAQTPYGVSYHHSASAMIRNNAQHKDKIHRKANDYSKGLYPKILWVQEIYD